MRPKTLGKQLPNIQLSFYLKRFGAHPAPQLDPPLPRGSGGRHADRQHCRGQRVLGSKYVTTAMNCGLCKGNERLVSNRNKDGLDEEVSRGDCFQEDEEVVWCLGQVALYCMCIRASCPPIPPSLLSLFGGPGFWHGHHWVSLSSPCISFSSLACPEEGGQGVQGYSCPFFSLRGLFK